MEDKSLKPQDVMLVMVLLVIALVAALLYVMALYAPMPWSPLGQAATAETPAQSEVPAINLDQFDIPDGWAPGFDGTVIVLPREQQGTEA